MNRLNSESEKLPPAEMPAAPALPQPQIVERIVEKAVKPSLWSRLGVHLIGTAIWNLVMGNLWSWIPFIFAAVLGVIGWTVTPPKAIGEKIAGIEHRIEAATDRIAGHAETKAKQAVAPIAGASALPVPHLGKTPEQLLEHDRAEAEALGLAWQPDWSHEKFEVQIPIARREKADAERRERDESKRAELIGRATRVNFGVNADLDVEEMEKQVVAAERHVRADAEYQLEHRQWEAAMEEYRERLASGPNANCPSCRFPMRLHTTNTTRQAMCPKCRFITSRRVMLAQHRDPPPPKEPAPPRMNPGLLGRFFK